LRPRPAVRCRCPVPEGPLRLIAACLALLLLAAPPRPAAAAVFDAESFVLPNGLIVVVVENHRAPVVTQMVWYRVGAADETPGKSGLAHFLEHLLFKGTATAAPGEFSAMVAENGGVENAFTSRDYTGYYQTVAKDRLEGVMRYEADRMANLVLSDEIVAPERDVILEERRQRIDSSPTAQLDEAMMAALFQNHPYGRPIIGWQSEMEGLTTQDALDFYKRWYGPDNAILVLGGDITLAEARPLVEKYYGPLRPIGAPPDRERVREPPPPAPRSVTLTSPQAAEPLWLRAYLLPHRDELAPGDLEALQLLSEMLGGGATSRLYRALVVEQGLATSAGAYDRGDALDYPTFHLSAQPRQGVELAAVEQAMQAELERLLADGVTAEELRQAKDRLQASAIYARDEPSTGPRVVGAALAIGETLDEVQAWPERVEAVTAEQVEALLRRFLQPERSVTGYLLPREPS
jgi:zinc protease